MAVFRFAIEDNLKLRRLVSPEGSHGLFNNLLVTCDCTTLLLVSYRNRLTDLSNLNSSFPVRSYTWRSVSEQQ